MVLQPKANECYVSEKLKQTVVKCCHEEALLQMVCPKSLVKGPQRN